MVHSICFKDVKTAARGRPILSVPSKPPPRRAPCCFWLQMGPPTHPPLLPNSCKLWLPGHNDTHHQTTSGYCILYLCARCWQALACHSLQPLLLSMIGVWDGRIVTWWGWHPSQAKLSGNATDMQYTYLTLSHFSYFFNFCFVLLLYFLLLSTNKGGKYWKERAEDHWET